MLGIVLFTETGIRWVVSVLLGTCWILMGGAYIIVYRSWIWWVVSLIFGTMTGFSLMVGTVLNTEAGIGSVVSLLGTEILTCGRYSISCHSLDMVCSEFSIKAG